MLRAMLLLTPFALWLCPAAVQAGDSKRPLADLVADLKKGDAEKLRALEALGELGTKAADAAPALVDLFAEKNEDVRLGAALALGKIRRGATEPLVKALGSKDGDVRFYAAWSLGFVGPEAKSATPALVKALADAVPEVRRKAAYALGLVDADPETAAGPLVSTLGDDNEDVRQAAVTALPKMGKAAVPALIKSLDAEKRTLRDTARV